MLGRLLCYYFYYLLLLFFPQWIYIILLTLVKIQQKEIGCSLATRGQHEVTGCFQVVGRRMAGKLWGKIEDSVSDSPRALAAHRVASRCGFAFHSRLRKLAGGAGVSAPHRGPGKGSVTLGGPVSDEVTESQRRSPPESWLLLGDSALRASDKLGTVSRQGGNPRRPTVLFIRSPRSALPYPLGSRRLRGPTV